MKIYANEINLNERTDKQITVPCNSQFKIGVKATENGQEVDPEKIKIKDGGNAIGKIRYYIDNSVPDPAFISGDVPVKMRATRLMNNTGVDIPLCALLSLVDDFQKTWIFPNRALSAKAQILKILQYGAGAQGAARTIGYYEAAKISKISVDGWYVVAGINYEPLSTCTVLWRTNDVTEPMTIKEISALGKPADIMSFYSFVSSDVTSTTYSNYLISGYLDIPVPGYISSDEEYRNYKTFNAESDENSKKYTIEIGGYDKMKKNSIYGLVGNIGALEQEDQLLTRPVQINLTQNVQKTSVFEI